MNWCCLLAGKYLRHFQANFVQPAFLVSPLGHAVEKVVEDVRVLEVLVREHPPRVAQRGHSQGTAKVAGRQQGKARQGGQSN